MYNLETAVVEFPVLGTQIIGIYCSPIGRGDRALRELKAKGAQLIGVSHYLGLLLGETPSDAN